MTTNTTKTRQEPMATVSPAELRDIQSGLMAVPVRSNNWRDDQTIPLYLAAPVSQQSEAGAPVGDELLEEMIEAGFAAMAESSDEWRSDPEASPESGRDSFKVGLRAALRIAATQPTEAGAKVTCPGCNGMARYIGQQDGYDDAECAMCDGEGKIAKPTEAGAPTAAAELVQPQSVSDERKSFDAYWGALDSDDATEDELLMLEQVAWQAWQARPRHCLSLPLSAYPKGTTYDSTLARESAAPAAPVREGDRELDAKLRKQVTEALTDAKMLLELNGITLDDDCDYGNGRADDIIARMDKAVAAMQKGAQENG